MCLNVNERYQAIRQFQQKFDLSVSETAQCLGICYQTVSNANNNLNPKQRTYEHKLKENHRIFIHTKTLIDPHITGAELANLIYEFFGLKVSERTVNRCRNDLKLQYRAQIRSVLLSENAILKRKAWTQFHLDHQSHFRNVAFSDESWFLLGRNKRWVWVDKENMNEMMFSRSVAHPPKVMVWGSIGWNFRSELIFIDFSVNTKNYIDKIILESNFVEDADRCWGVGNWYFQQDNAPAHRSAETRAVLDELGLDLLQDWPPYSPDLNIIEVIWAIMEDRVEKRQPKTLDELKQVILDVWNNLGWQTINGLVDSMHNRLKTVNEKPNQTIWRLNKA